MRETERERGGAISHHRTFCLALPCHGGCLYAVFCCIQKELGWMILQNRMREERIGPDSFLRPTIILDQGAVQSELRAFQALVAPCAPGQNTLPLAKRRNCLSFHKHLPLSTRCPSSLFLPSCCLCWLCVCVSASLQSAFVFLLRSVVLFLQKPRFQIGKLAISQSCKIGLDSHVDSYSFDYNRESIDTANCESGNFSAL